MAEQANETNVAPSSVLKAMDLHGLVALVTGGGSGLGRAIARGLHEAGATVAITGRRRGVLEEAAGMIGDRVLRVPGDVTKEPEEIVAKVSRELGRLDVLVNAAGVTIVKPSLDLTRAEYNQVMDTNLSGVFFTSVAAARQFRAQARPGAIVNIASIGALRGGAGVYSVYSASKGGVVALTRSHAAEWARHRIRVNCVAAGAFHTDMSSAAYEDPNIHERYVSRIPIGRTGEPHEIAPLAVYLSSSASAFVTGEVFTIDGGQAMQ